MEACPQQAREVCHAGEEEVGRCSAEVRLLLRASHDRSSPDARVLPLLDVCDGVPDLQHAALWLAENAPKDFEQAGAASYDVMTMFGIVSLGFMWAQMAKTAQAKLDAGEGDAEFYKRKLVLAKFWMEREMPMTASLKTRSAAGAETLMELDAASF